MNKVYFVKCVVLFQTILNTQYFILKKHTFLQWNGDLGQKQWTEQLKQRTISHACHRQIRTLLHF